MHKRLKMMIEKQLYEYNSLERKIIELQNDIDSPDFKQNYSSYIKYVSSSLENQVIKNFEKELKIHKLKQWKNIINKTLNICQDTDLVMYQYIVLKYFKHLDKDKIRKKLNIEFDKQEDMRNEILQYIFFHAQSEGLIK